MKFKLRKQQQEKAIEINNILNKFKVCYLAGQTRSGKSLTVLQAAKLFEVDKILFITKKKAISSIESDYKLGQFKYQLVTINYESVHKIKDTDFDLIVCDEAHSLSKFPKPAKRTSLIKKQFSHIPMILLSGSPAIESYSQWFHQFWISKYSPFKEYRSFYKWATDFVFKQKKRIGTHEVTDYSKCDEVKIDKILNPYKVIMKKQKDKFKSIDKHIINLKLPDNLFKLSDRLMSDRAIEGKTGFILGDTPAKLQSKVHQIHNGSVIIEDEMGSTTPIILSDYKAKYIKEKFKNKKISIVFYYRSEREILLNTFKDEITEDLDEFNNSDKNFLIQAKTTEGMNLSASDCLVFYNFGFSGKDYQQSIDRLTIRGRETNDVYFILSGINHKIFKQVEQKKDYNSRSFIKDYGIKKTK